MKWEAIALIAWLGLGVILAPILIGKERKPHTAQSVITGSLITLAQIYLLVRLG